MGDSFPDTAPVRRPSRPSVMDLRFRGDAWLEVRGDGQLALCLGNYRLAVLRGLSVDVPHLNGLLNRLRERRRVPV